MARNLLSKYNEKRDFGITAEPKGKTGKSGKKLRFVIQLHHATRTHYDFRLEWHGVMKSWAVTKGPSYDPADKRLAVRTEDHPMDYNSFEGVIPDKQYGAGPVMIWDEGVWIPDNDPEKMERKGHISFTIEGTRMHGHWHLVRMHTKEKRENWLLIKGDDEFVLSKTKNASFLKKENISAVTGRTIEEIRAAGLGNTGKMKLKAKGKPPAKKAVAKNVSINALLKKYSTPELATLVQDPPQTKDWVHEIKYDGYRLIAFIVGEKIVLQTRGGKDWTHKFQPLADALLHIKLKSAVLDLEACVTNAKGKTDFSALQAALTDNKMEKIGGWVFDILFLNGEDYTKRPLLERKEVLTSLLKGVKFPLHYSEHFESKPDILDRACAIGAEGLVSKLKDSFYQHKRTKDWLKSKCGLEQEFVIGGFMPAKDNPRAVGSLLLGYYKGKKLHYAGKVGTGFTRKLASDIYSKIIKLKAKKAPFYDALGSDGRGAVFVKPETLCQVSFLEWTPEKHIRHSSFKGLREDKKPNAVHQEKPVKLSTVEPKVKTKGLEIDGVKITHPERKVFPSTDITKGDVAEYYDTVAPLMLPFVKDRLVSLLRCTDGISGQCFFQRNPMKGMGDYIKSKKITHKGNQHEYLYIEDEVGLIQLVQMGTFEFHGWQSKLVDKGKPDQIIFDLDPDPDVPFEAVKLAAEDIRQRLKKMKLVSFARLSGGKGVHVVAPIQPEHNWDEVKEFARGFAEKMAKDVPTAYVANMSKAKRKGKIFVDFFRNDFSSTAIVPFSLRAREGAPIAWPVSWVDLKNCKSASSFKLETLKPRHIKDAQRQVDAFRNIRQKLVIV